MRKIDEIEQPDSCLNRARDKEMLFVLCGDEECAPDTIRDWVERRIRKGKNLPTDAKIIEALLTAKTMEMDAKRPGRRT